MKKITRKYIAKKTTPQQVKQIEEIQNTLQKNEKRTVTYAEAKEEYFGKQALYDKRLEHDKAIQANRDSMAAENIVAAVEKREAKEPKQPMTIEQTKLGITVVISKEECQKLGFKLDMKSRDAIHEVKKILKLVD